MHHCPVDDCFLGVTTAKDAEGLCWWLLQQLASLYRYDKTGQETTQVLVTHSSSLHTFTLSVNFQDTTYKGLNGSHAVLQIGNHYTFS